MKRRGKGKHINLTTKRWMGTFLIGLPCSIGWDRRRAPLCMSAFTPMSTSEPSNAPPNSYSYSYSYSDKYNSNIIHNNSKVMFSAYFASI